jgi:MFS family permease
MYQVQDSQALLTAHRRLLRRDGAAPAVARTVMLLGLTSLFTDISSEMVATILPLYLVYTVGLTPLQYGVVDGLYQGSAALVRVAGGFFGDRFNRHKEVAAVGYGLSAVCKLGFLVVGGVVGALSAIIVLDRTGKGIRTAPRDAMISLSTPKEKLGLAFGVHRALDTTGAMLGPLLAFVLLAFAPGHYDTIFVVSFLFALIGFAILVLFVQNRPAEAPEIEPEPVVQEKKEAVSVRSAAGLLRDRRFSSLVAIGSALALVTMSDGFVYLGLQKRLDFDVRFLPLLFVGTSLVYMLLAVPVGRLADRIGRGRVFVGGYVMLMLVYLVLLAPSIGNGALFLLLVAFGTYYAATDGVLMALASSLLPRELRASGLALLTTGTNLASFAASALFGALWTVFGFHTAVLAFGCSLIVVTAAAAVMVAVRRRDPVDA